MLHSLFPSHEGLLPDVRVMFSLPDVRVMEC